MTVETNPRPEVWDAFLQRQAHTPLLQSWAWGEFQRRVGRPATRCLLSAASQQPIAALQMLTHRYPLGFCSLYVPRGPVFRDASASTQAEVWQTISDTLRSLAEKVHAVFVRFEPATSIDPSRWLTVRRVDSVQPTTTHLLDLTKTEAQLLAAMHPKTRYNIRLAERHGVAIEPGGEGNLDEFLALHRETEEREGVRFFRPDYFRAMFATPELKPLLRHSLARFQGKMLAGILVAHYGDTATYLHGGSSREARSVMAPHLIQWRAILAAKAAGFRWYDFRGVAPADAPASHPWAGLSRFKRGFGGFDVEYPGAYDWVRRPMWYEVYRMAQKMKN